MSSSPSKPKVIVVCGPTATGKSDMAVSIARDIQSQFGIPCEIISADSRQVYTSLDIGTGKITAEEMQGIPHHMIDVVTPDHVYSVVQYKTHADACIADIHARGHIPILCGGTAQYIDAVIFNITLPEVPPNEALRAELEQYSHDALIERFATLNSPNGVAQPHAVDLANKRRVIRAIEILEALGHIPEITTNERFDVLWIGLDTSDVQLKKNISKRLRARMDAGMLEESIKLLESGAVTMDRMYTLGLEYAYLADLIQGYCTLDECITRLEFAIWHYAKRQRTWMRKNKNIHWLDKYSQRESSIPMNVSAEHLSSVHDGAPVTGTLTAPIYQTLITDFLTS